MNHKLIYDKLIKKAKLRVLDEGVYYETHHIVPRCQGGNNSKDNLVKLTAKEHYLAHALLAKHYGGVHWKAARMMGYGKRNSKGDKITGAMFSYTKEKWAKTILAEGNPAFKRERSLAVRNKISLSLKGRKQTEEHIINARNARPYKPLSDAEKRNLRLKNSIRKYKTPKGIYFSSTEAAEVMGVSHRSILNWCKNPNNKDYKFLET